MFDFITQDTDAQRHSDCPASLPPPPVYSLWTTSWPGLLSRSSSSQRSRLGEVIVVGSFPSQCLIAIWHESTGIAEGTETTWCARSTRRLGYPPGRRAKTARIGQKEPPEQVNQAFPGELETGMRTGQQPARSLRAAAYAVIHSWSPKTTAATSRLWQPPRPVKDRLSALYTT